MRVAIMACSLGSWLNFHVTNGPISVPKVVDFNLVAEFVCVNIIVLHGSRRSARRSSRDRAARFGTSEGPFAWITVLNHIIHINVMQRVFLGNATHIRLSSRRSGRTYTSLNSMFRLPRLLCILLTSAESCNTFNSGEADIKKTSEVSKTSEVLKSV